MLVALYCTAFQCQIEPIDSIVGQIPIPLERKGGKDAEKIFSR
jgi:hypothetical protein